jgi:DNA-binding NtrC family response regulator
VTAGPDASKQLLVDGAKPGRLLVGTGPTCHWVLTDGKVSRRHLALSLSDGALMVEDLNATNGTFVGSLRIRNVSLQGGEDLFLASTRIRVERLAERAEVTVARAANFGRVIGASVAMRRLYPTLVRLARTDVPVLIEGEAGTGKELVGEALHEEGARAERDLVVFDARSTNADAAEARLFGAAGVIGAVEQSQRGTLVIDEPAELPISVQMKLTRWLERRPIARADGSPMTPSQTDPRVVVLSRSDVEREVQAGRLVEALAVALGGARVELPPLRDRPGDITLLATAFFRALGLEDRGLAPLTVRRFEAYTWPGNVRELKNAVARAATTGDDALDPRAIFSAEDADGRDTLPNELYRRVLEAELTLTQARDIVIADFDRRFVRRVLERHNGNVTHAAAASGLARRYFQVLRAKRGA